MTSLKDFTTSNTQSTLDNLVYTLSGPKELFLKEEAISSEKELSALEVLAETHYSAISPGTEYAAYSGMSPLRPGKVYPRLMGYCNVAKVIGLGDKVEELQVGDYILTFQSHRKYFKFPANDFYLKVPEGSLKDVVPAYLYHLGYHALITANSRQGHNVGIIGGGTLGYTSAIMSEICGAKTFVLSNIPDIKTEVDWNNITTFDKSDASLEEIDNETKGVGIDIVINTSNKWSDWLLALKMANRGGTIVNMGFPGRGQETPSFNPLEPQYIYDKQLTIKALININETGREPYEERFNVKRNLEYIIDLILSGKVKSAQILSEEIPYTELSDQYEKYTSRSQYLLSTLLRWKD